MFSEPESITGSNAYRSTDVTPPRGLVAKRDGYAERTVTTSDGVRLAIRDYGSAGTREHTVVLLHGLSKYSGPDWRGAAALRVAAIRTTPLTTAAGFLPSLKRYDEYHALATIGANTVVVSGGADRTTPTSHARDMAAAIPGATHVHQPTAGHMLLEERPRCVSDAIDSVLGMRAFAAQGAAN